MPTRGFMNVLAMGGYCSRRQEMPAGFVVAVMHFTSRSEQLACGLVQRDAANDGPDQAAG